MSPQCKRAGSQILSTKHKDRFTLGDGGIMPIKPYSFYHLTYISCIIQRYCGTKTRQAVWTVERAKEIRIHNVNLLLTQSGKNIPLWVGSRDENYRTPLNLWNSNYTAMKLFLILLMFTFFRNIFFRLLVPESIFKQSVTHGQCNNMFI